jgi:F-type H+-transporting ATPase subunit b
MSSSIGFEANTAIWTVINFVILLGLVHRFALPSFYKMVDDSEDKRNSLLLELEAKVKESDRLISEYNEKIASADKAAVEILAKAQKEAEELKRQEMQELVRQKQQILSGVQGEITSEKNRAIDDVRSHAADLIVSATAKILKREVSDAAHMEIIQSDIAQFERVFRS